MCMPNHHHQLYYNIRLCLTTIHQPYDKICVFAKPQSTDQMQEHDNDEDEDEFQGYNQLQAVAAEDFNSSKQVALNSSIFMNL